MGNSDCFLTDRSRTYLLDAAEMRETDRRTSDVIGIPSLVLMERAALATRDAILQDPRIRRLPEGRKNAVIVCGRGNNGADGMALARLLADIRIPVSVLVLQGERKQGSAASIQAGILEQYGISLQVFNEENAETLFGKQPAVIVDAVAGTGLAGGLKGDAAAAAEWINRCRSTGALVCSVDIPSGADSTDGSVGSVCVRADITVTYGFYKAGLFLAPASEYCGEILRADIGINERALASQPRRFTYLDVEAARLLPARDPNGNKGTFGKVLVIAGSRDVCGAAILSAKACMRSGAGMVRVFTHASNRNAVLASVPEALLTLYEDHDPALPEKLDEALAWCDVCAAGPGISTGKSGKNILRQLFASEYRPQALVIDADAVRILAADKELRDAFARTAGEIPAVMTPHLAEFSAISGTPVPELKDHAELLHELEKVSSLLHCTVLCKDHRSIVYQSGQEAYYINTSGNSGMATAGSGDVLTGMTAAFMALIKDGFAAACAAAYLHGRAGDAAAAAGSEAGLIASDIIDAIPGLLLL